jgi:hypothetical protein
VIVETNGEGARAVETEPVERGVFGTKGRHGQRRFDFGKSDLIVAQ